MGLYLYCIGDTTLPAPGSLEGVGTSDVRALDLGGFRLWISGLDATPTASLEEIEVHNRVVEAAGQDVSPLPVRFGQWFASTAELEGLLTERGDRLRTALETVRGAVEYGVRVVDPARAASDPPDRTTGKAYLESLARRERDSEAARERGESLAGELRAHLGDAIRDQRVLSGEGALVRIAHLVPRHDTGTYGERLRTFPDRYPHLHFAMSGPWPPYGFADDGP